MDAISVLLVDENPTFLRMASRVLREYYHEEVTVVGVSPGGDDAVHLAQQLKPCIVLLGMDAHSKKSLQLIPQLRAVMPAMGIIVLGPLDIASECQVALDAGADGFIAKAVLHNEVLITIRRTIGRATAGSQSLWQCVSIPAMDAIPLTKF